MLTYDFSRITSGNVTTPSSPKLTAGQQLLDFKQDLRPDPGAEADGRWSGMQNTSNCGMTCGMVIVEAPPPFGQTTGKGGDRSKYPALTPAQEPLIRGNTVSGYWALCREVSDIRWTVKRWRELTPIVPTVSSIYAAEPGESASCQTGSRTSCSIQYRSQSTSFSGLACSIHDESWGEDFDQEKSYRQTLRHWEERAPIECYRLGLRQHRRWVSHSHHRLVWWIPLMPVKFIDMKGQN